jgi:hypothetical protein
VHSITEIGAFAAAANLLIAELRAAAAGGGDGGGGAEFAASALVEQLRSELDRRKSQVASSGDRCGRFG